MRTVLVNDHVWHEDERRRKSLWLSFQFLWSSSTLISAPVVRLWADAARWLVWKPRLLLWKPSWISVQRDDLPQNLKGWTLWNLNRAEAPSMDCLVSHTYQICSSALHPLIQDPTPSSPVELCSLLVLWADKFPLPLTQAPPPAPLPWPRARPKKPATVTTILAQSKTQSLLLTSDLLSSTHPLVHWTTRADELFLPKSWTRGIQHDKNTSSYLVPPELLWGSFQNWNVLSNQYFHSHTRSTTKLPNLIIGCH